MRAAHFLAPVRAARPAPLARCILAAAACLALAAAPARGEGRRLALQGNDKLAIVTGDGQIEWQMPWGPIHDIHRLDNGHFMVQQGAAKVVEIDPAAKEVVWSYDSATQNGNAGKAVEVHSFQPLEGGRVMIAESGVGRIIEVDREGTLLKAIRLKVKAPHPHRDTRLVRKLPSGNYLVCHEGDGAVREYDGASGQVVWEFDVPLFGRERAEGHGPEAFGNQTFAALRLENGNTLVTTGNGHSVLEVTPAKEIAWKLEQRDLAGITLAWVTTIEVTPRGTYVIGNCHAGPGNPQVIEVDPKTKKVLWSFDEFDAFGNDVSNTLVLEQWDDSAP
jgi:outer membrane protein assembly factor BamB